MSFNSTISLGDNIVLYFSTKNERSPYADNNYENYNKIR